MKATWMSFLYADDGLEVRIRCSAISLFIQFTFLLSFSWDLFHLVECKDATPTQTLIFSLLVCTLRSPAGKREE